MAQRQPRTSLSSSRQHLIVAPARRSSTDRLAGTDHLAGTGLRYRLGHPRETPLPLPIERPPLRLGHHARQAHQKDALSSRTNTRNVFLGHRGEQPTLANNHEPSSVTTSSWSIARG